MSGCPRCGRPFEPSRPHERYCPPCTVDIATRDARPPEPVFVPEWMRRSLAKDLTPGRAA